MTGDVLLSAEALVCGYDGRGLLPSLDVSIRAGQRWALVGRNGGGKTTVLRTILGLLPPVSGRVARRDGLSISYLAQRHEVARDMPGRVVDLVRQGLDKGWSFLDPVASRRQHALVADALTAVEANHLADHRWSALSEGQKQRTLLARALVSRPDLLILDEPTSALDPVNEGAIFELLDRLRHERGLTVMMASHRLAMLPQLADFAILVAADRGDLEHGAVADVMRTPTFRAHFGQLLLNEAEEVEP